MEMVTFEPCMYEMFGFMSQVAENMSDLKLRDLFAMVALQGLIPTPWGQSSDTSYAAISDVAYSIADTMIEARKRK